MASSFSAHGKLLLTGEYLVLDGAKALAIPTRFRQQMRVSSQDNEDKLIWRAKDHENQVWFQAKFHNLHLAEYEASRLSEFKRLQQILKAADEQRPDIWRSHLRERVIETTLDFDRNWGLGTSSTLSSLLSQYLEIDPYRLLEDTFGGSGYDLACATAEGPITYIRNGTAPKVESIKWQPDWLDQTYFVYLGKKQNSREGIRYYREHGATTAEIELITQYTDQLIAAISLSEAQGLLNAHENLVSQIIDMPSVQETLFPDFPGVVKSLGAWGGDFVWALADQSSEVVERYFKNGGYPTILKYEDMIK